MLDVCALRADFPILNQNIDGKKLIYLDNAATTQMPKQVMDRLALHYTIDNANVHRGLHSLSERSTGAYEAARQTAANFIGAKGAGDLVFTSGTTGSINMAAQALENNLPDGGNIVVTELEHHSNYLPWLMLSKKKGAEFRVVKCPNGDFDIGEFNKSVDKNTRIAAFSQVSNVTGAVAPAPEITEICKKSGALTLIDGAQGLRHTYGGSLDGVDFYAFSGHKALGPSGIGGLYVSDTAKALLNPVVLGGGMVGEVDANSYSLAPFPYCMEAGTPNYSGAIALAEALNYIEAAGRKQIAEYEEQLSALTAELLLNITGVKVLGSPKNRCGAVSFTAQGFDAYDLVSLLDKRGVAVRGGTLCAQPALKSLNATSCVRVSPAFYNTPDEIKYAVNAIAETIDMLKRWTS